MENHKDANESVDPIESIAIIGMTCRFPGAGNIETFWENLKKGVESIVFFSEAEVLEAGVDSVTLEGSHFVKAGGYLEGIEFFDASFFGFTPREAEILDPQHRLFIECAWEVMERSGYDSEKYRGRIGVYTSSSLSTYVIRNIWPNRERLGAMGGVSALIGNDKDHVATRVSYALNLTGPSLNIGTACSSSLVAVHMACQGLLDYHCDMALVGGVTIHAGQGEGYLHSSEGIASPDGHCRAFDRRSKGTISGNGVGIVLLKRMEDALEDGDGVESLILGSAVNNDGSLKVGYTAPGVEGQAGVIAEAQSLANVKPESVTYVETHGTGTMLGDPIEINALCQAFSKGSKKRQFCALGSVKTNIGHLDSAAGIAGLIKTSLALKHQMIPPSLHYEQANSAIDFENSPFYVNNRLLNWDCVGAPRRAAVSSFAMGGTNAHVVLEEWRGTTGSVELGGQTIWTKSDKFSNINKNLNGVNTEGFQYHLIILSAKTERALQQMSGNLGTYLNKNKGISLGDVQYTLQVGRRDFDFRQALICKDTFELTEILNKNLSGRMFSSRLEKKNPAVVFMLTGLGSQYVHMGRDLYHKAPVFRQSMDQCFHILETQMGIDLKSILFPDDQSWGLTGSDFSSREEHSGFDFRKMVTGQGKGVDEKERMLNQTLYAHTAIFSMEYALAQLWMVWGIEPGAMIGHSLGEYTAACIAGVFSLEDALKVIVERAQMIEKLPQGSMLGISQSETEIQPFLNEKLSLAAINDPGNCVVSGDTSAIIDFQNNLIKRGIVCRLLSTQQAFHSHLLAPIKSSLLKLFQSIPLKEPQIPIISNVTGQWLSRGEAVDPSYWVRQTCETVRFCSGIEQLWQEEYRVFLELGPGQILSGFVLQHPDMRKIPGLTVLASLHNSYENQADDWFLLHTLGKLWLSGVRINWESYYSHHDDRKPQRILLPTYPFERDRYWISENFSRKNRGTGDIIEEAENVSSSDDYLIPTWKRTPMPYPEIDSEDKNQCCLVFFNAGDFEEAFIKAIEKEFGECVKVEASQSGECFQRKGAHYYSLPPDEMAGYDALFKELDSLGKTPTKILHLWSLSGEILSSFSESDDDGVLSFGIFSLLELAKALDSCGLSDLLITVVTNHIFDVNGVEVLYPGKATLLSALKVLPLDFPQIRCQCIDIHYPPRDAGVEKMLIRQLMQEMKSDGKDLILAYRGRYRWLHCLEPLALPGDNRKNAAKKQEMLRHDGIYLITGGLGQRGLKTAEFIAASKKAKIVLVDHRKFPAQETWSDWLMKDENDPKQLDFISSLEFYVDKMFPIKGIEEYPGLVQKLNELCTRYVCEYFLNRLNWRRGQVYNYRDLSENIVPSARKFFHYFLDLLSEDGIIQMREEGFEIRIEPDQIGKPESLFREMKDQYPQFKGLLELLAYCSQQYEPVFKGEKENPEVFYSQEAQNFLKDTPGNILEHEKQESYLGVVQELIAAQLSKDTRQTIRILEVGGGTGRLTKCMVEILQGRDIEYYFTDLGKSFVTSAEKMAARQGYDFMKFGVLDISTDPNKQGYNNKSFDIILAFDVVHATPLLKKTIKNLKQLLQPGGFLYLIEGVKPRRWSNLIWGMQTGWWYFEDLELRKTSPLLTLDQWDELMRSFQFKEVRTYPKQKKQRKLVDFALILAEKESVPGNHTPLFSISELDKEWVKRGQTLGEFYRHLREKNSGQVSKKSGINKTFQKGVLHQTQEKIRRFFELEKMGAEIVFRYLDVTHELQMPAILTDILEQYGQFNGIFHLANMTQKQRITSHLTERDSFLKSPELRGTALLIKWVKIMCISLDFMILSPGSSAFFPDQYQIYSCAGHWYQGMVARKNELNGEFPIVAIDERGTIGDEKPIQIMNRILNQMGEPQIVLKSHKQMSDGFVKASPSPPMKKSEGLSAHHPRPNLRNPYIAPRNQLEKDLVSIWQQLFGIGEIGIYDSFLELGGDSLLATQVISRIQGKFNLQLHLRQLFEKPTVAHLAEEIEAQRKIIDEVLSFPESQEDNHEEGWL